MTVSFYCPKCSVLLSAKEGRLECGECSIHFPSKDGFYIFDDSELVNQLDYGHGDEIIDIERVQLHKRLKRYILPVLGDQVRGKKILSVGCGAGSDVAELNRCGGRAYGMDFAYRTNYWQRKGLSNQQFFISSSDAIPFPDEYFDIIFCFGVIEHVGETYYEKRDFRFLQRERKNFLKNLIAKLKMNGKLLITSPNRNFPVDFQHDHEKSRLLSKLNIFVHSPFERFLESYYSLERLLRRAGRVKTSPLPLQGLFGFSVASKSRLFSFFLSAIKTYLKLLDKMPGPIKRSFINPYLAVEVLKI